MHQGATQVAPHVAEECWEATGGDGLVIEANWPVADPEMLVSDTITLPVQVNGKKRSDITVSADATKDDIEAIALADTDVQRFTSDKTVRKIIVVPGRIVNIVVG